MLVVIVLHFQRAFICESLVTIGATEWLFIVILHHGVIVLHFQRPSVCKFLVAMGATEWLFILVLHPGGNYVAILEGLHL